MKKLMMSAVCAMMAAAATFAEPKVEITEAYQENPGSGIVNYTYTVSGLKGVTDLYIKVGAKGCDKTETITVESVAEGTVTTSVDVKKLLGKAYPNVTLFAELELEDGVQLWANGPYFAKANIGATKPEESGYYFWWGDTVGYRRNSSNNGWVSVKDGSDFSFASANCPTYDLTVAQLYSKGYIDANSTSGKLTSEYDAARAYMGAPWRMMTDAELNKLLNTDYCILTWVTSYKGKSVAGCVAQGAKDPYKNNEVFFPVVGSCSGTGLSNANTVSTFWSSSPSQLNDGRSCHPTFRSDGFYHSANSRFYGRPVRAVRDAK